MWEGPQSEEPPKSHLTKFPDSSREVVFHALYKTVVPQGNTEMDYLVIDWVKMHGHKETS